VWQFHFILLCLEFLCFPYVCFWFRTAST
jgi:hypothetical protein